MEAPAEIIDALTACEGALHSLLPLEGGNWKPSKASKGGRVWTQAAKGTKALRFRAAIIIQSDDDLQLITSQLSDFSKRLKWDSALASGETVCQYANGVSICSYTTQPAAAGVIKPRLFVDCRRFYTRSDGACVDTRVHWGGADDQVATKGYVRGANLPGGGLLVEHVQAGGDPNQPKQLVRVTMVAHTEIGGWLPASLVNASTAGVLLELLQGMALHCGGAVVEGAAAEAALDAPFAAPSETDALSASIAGGGGGGGGGGSIFAAAAAPE